MNLNDFSKWLQYNRVKNLRGSEYFPYPLYIKGSSQAFLLNKSTEVALNVISNGVLRYLI